MSTSTTSLPTAFPTALRGTTTTLRGLGTGLGIGLRGIGGFFMDPNPRSIFSMLFGRWVHKAISDDEMAFRLIEWGRTPATRDDIAHVYYNMTGTKPTRSELRGYLHHLDRLGLTR